MFFLSFFLLLVALSEQHNESQGYTSVIESNILECIQITGEPPDHLNLSYLGLSAISRNAFANLPNLKTLNLANNKLNILPSLSHLSNLESLILEDNNIKSGNFYVGLSKLEVLNIANNPLTSFKPGHFFGLSKSVRLWTKGLALSSISAAMFERLSPGEENRPLYMEHEEDIDYDIHGIAWSGPMNNIDIKVCIQDGHLTSVEELQNSLFLPDGCRKIGLDSPELSLMDMGIKSFESGWYRLKTRSVTSIVLSDNQISQFSNQLLNDLPTGIRKIYLSGNKIKILPKGIIENSNLTGIDMLDLGDNSITDIEYGAFEKLNLTGELLLDRNRLTNTRFLDSLPPYIQHVMLNYNNITEISSGNFTKFKHFTRLRLAHNEIKELEGYELHGFSSLTHLSLQKNGLENVELEAFLDLTNLMYLDLSNNRISGLPGGIFSGLDKLRFISLYNNKLEDHLNILLVKMPNSLETLWLGRNNIRCGSTRIFSPGTIIGLGVRGNNPSINISYTYNLPNLKVLDLHSNLLKDIDGGSFKGLDNLTILSLAANKIETIKKGLAQNLSNLYILDLSRNPIKKLTDGALFGLTKDSRTIVRVKQVPLHVIEGGVFDNV